MKQFFTFCVIILSLQLNAQLPVENLINRTWVLEHLEHNELDPTYNYLSSTEYNHITLNFYLENDELRYQTTVCATKTGRVNQEYEMIVFQASSVNGQTCQTQDSNAFEAQYFNHIFDEEYWLAVNQTSSTTFTLNISSPSFCEARFTAPVLNLQEQVKATIILSPNPVKDQLFIKNPTQKQLEITIADTNGRSVLNQKLKSTSSTIDFKHFPKGVYIVSIKANNEIVETKKIIKQ